MEFTIDSIGVEGITTTITATNGAKQSGVGNIVNASMELKFNNPAEAEVFQQGKKIKVIVTAEVSDGADRKDRS